MTFEAIYENGVFRPLEKLGLENRQHVLLSISEVREPAGDVSGYFESEEWEPSKRDDISLEQVQRATSSIKGSLADAVIASQDERF